MPGWPERIFYTVSELANIWQVNTADIQQWLSHGYIKGHVWLPLISVYEMEAQVIGTKVTYCQNMRHWEGYTSICPDQCRQLFRSECIHLRAFECSEDGSYLYLPESAEGVCLKQDDLVILDKERKAFEIRRNIRKNVYANVTIIGQAGAKNWVNVTKHSDMSFKKVTFNGQEYTFGTIQAGILRLLYDAATTDQPWQNGKQLLNKVGSQSFSIANVFKRNTIWRQLIISDGRGMYRMSDALLSTLFFAT